MDDLFPDSLEPHAIGFGAIRYMAPVFFAIYPPVEDLPRIVEWQRRVCRQIGLSRVVLRPPELLHLSVAACGTPRQQRDPLDVALRSAAECFSCASFKLTLNATAIFGKDDRAFVAVTDVLGARTSYG